MKQRSYETRGSSGGVVPMRSRSTGDRRLAEVQSSEQVATPEIRFVRMALFGQVARPYGGDWDEYLNEFGSMAYGDGRVKSLGGMAVTYVSANTMGRMLTDRYPRDFKTGSLAKARACVNELHSDFAEFVRKNDAATTALLTALDDRELVFAGQKAQLDEGYDPYGTQHEGELSRVARNKLWRPGLFTVRDLAPYGKFDLGADLAHPDNDAIADEYRMIVDEFLNGEHKLPVKKYTETHLDPHVTFFKGTRPIAQLSLRHLGPPEEIMLDRPSAVVNLKK